MMNLIRIAMLMSRWNVSLKFQQLLSESKLGAYFLNCSNKENIRLILSHPKEIVNQ